MAGDNTLVFTDAAFDQDVLNSLEPVLVELRISLNLIHESAGHLAWVDEAVFPRLHGLHGDAEEKGENCLASTE